MFAFRQDIFSWEPLHVSLQTWWNTFMPLGLGLYKHFKSSLYNNIFIIAQPIHRLFHLHSVGHVANHQLLAPPQLISRHPQPLCHHPQKPIIHLLPLSLILHPPKPIIHLPLPLVLHLPNPMIHFLLFPVVVHPSMPIIQIPLAHHLPLPSPPQHPPLLNIRHFHSTLNILHLQSPINIFHLQ